DEQLDRLDAGPGRRDDLLGDERGRLRQHVPEERTDLLGRRAEVIERLSDAREAAGELREDALQEVLTEPRQRRAHVLERPLHGLAGLQRRAAEAALHRVAERVEVDLALGGQLDGLLGRLTKLLRQELDNRDAAVVELGDDLALHLVRRRDLV